MKTTAQMLCERESVMIYEPKSDSYAEVCAAHGEEGITIESCAVVVFCHDGFLEFSTFGKCDAWMKSEGLEFP